MADQKFKVVVAGMRPGQPNTVEVEELAPYGIKPVIVAAGVPDDELLAAIGDADAILGYQPLPRNIIEKLQKAKVVSSPSIGVDRVDLEAASEKGIVVTNSGDVFADEVANHAMALLLACARKLRMQDLYIRESKWTQAAVKPPNINPMGRITGQTLGLLGFGNIARRVARRAKPFGLNIIATDPYLPDSVFEQEGVKKATVDEVMSQSDYISVHIPLGPSTKHLVGARTLGLMKPTAYIINTARGPIIDQDALIKILQENKIAGAGLDVFENEPLELDSPLSKLDNVLLSPHTASNSDEAYINARRRAVQETMRVLRGKMPLSPVNRDVLAKLNLVKE
jgi:D-3-phosphoglycerate dehydrogenase / 2-oxoglutarate reductase